MKQILKEILEDIVDDMWLWVPLFCSLIALTVSIGSLICAILSR